MTTRERLTRRAGLVLLFLIVLIGVGLGLGSGAGHSLVLENKTDAEITGLVLTVGDTDRDLPPLRPLGTFTEALALESGQSVGLRFVAGDRGVGKVRTGRLEFGPGEAVAVTIAIDRNPAINLLEGRIAIERHVDWPARLRRLFGR